jgi:Rad3-related DNA helicase
MASSSTAEGEGDDGNFDFPFDRPYPEQLRLMQSIRECIRSSAVGIFESPTGEY